MPRVSGFETLAPEHRAWLLNQWRRSGYGENQRIAVDLAARLIADGEAPDAPPDPSTVYRWARAERTRAGRIRAAAELRAATIAALPEDDPGLADKVGAYMEGRLVEALEDLDAIEGLSPMDRLAALAEASKANTARRKVTVARDQADLARARFDAEQQIRADERAKAAGAAETAARGQGVSPEGIAALREAIMGAL